MCFLMDCKNFSSGNKKIQHTKIFFSFSFGIRKQHWCVAFYLLHYSADISSIKSFSYKNMKNTRFCAQ